MVKHLATPPSRQRGIATLLIVLMLGLAVSVTVMATVYSVRSAQSQQLTSHTATTAQAAAWRGVEALRQYLLQVGKPAWPGLVGNTARPVTGLQALGVSAATVSSIAPSGADSYQVQASVTGEAGVGSAYTTSTVQVVYNITPGYGSPGSPMVCAALPKAPMVFNGDLTYSGGQLDADQSAAEWDYKNIVVAGKLSVSGGSTAKISGCVKGDANISGGGLTDNGHIYSEGTITLQGMAFPANTALWGRAVVFNGGSGGPPNKVWAGAWQTDVYSSGSKIGSAVIGGQLLAGTTPASLPWTSGTVIPTAGEQTANRFVVTLLDGTTQYLLDLGQLSVDASTGIVTGAAASAQQIAGTAGTPLNDSLSFRATGVAATGIPATPGGSISMSSGASLSVSGTLWGQDVSILNWSQSFPTLLANGNLRITGNDTKIDSLLGGGNFTAMNGNCAFSNITNGGKIAGSLLCSGGTPAPANAAPSVAAGNRSANPGLPGLPYCDARVNPIDASSFKPTANYVYEKVNGNAQLTIQHVKNAASGASIDGVYPLNNLSAAQRAILQSLMTCSNGNDPGCVNTVLQANGSWLLSGVNSFPPGVLWFDNALKVSGTASNLVLVNTVINKGGPITMGDAGGPLKLQAPNLALSASGAPLVCASAYYPTNLCQSPTALATWTDQAGTVHQGMPVANTAIITDSDLAAAGWTITGNVILGGKMGTSGAAVNILGSLTVGSNQTSNTTVSGGGIHVQTPFGGDSSQLPSCNGKVQPFQVPSSATVQWSRYL